MNLHESIREALRSTLNSRGATCNEIRQAEALLSSLADSIEEQRSVRKPHPCELRKAVRDNALDQLWRKIEDRHFDRLKGITEDGIRTATDETIARVCAGIVLSEINLRKAQRILDVMNES